MIFENSKWIWAKKSLNVDDYSEFIFSVTPKSEQIILRLSCDSIYAVYINEKLEYVMECSDFPNDKFYDEYKISTKPNKEIEFKIDVWHYGIGSQKYIESNHGLIFEIEENNSIVLNSDCSIKSRVMNEFHNGLCKTINFQQGLSFEAYLDKKDLIFSESLDTNKNKNFSKRNINRLLIADPVETKCTKINSTCYLVDLKKEFSGIPIMDIVSFKKQKITVSFSEHLVNGEAKSWVGCRDFSFEINLNEGRNKFINPLKRIGCRYMQINSESPIEINYFSLRPINYEHKIISHIFTDELVNKIYEICLHTLECCMHEHYEDCPWREQCLYSLDSRNQMLCGYYAFEGFEYQKHNLLLLAKSITEEGLLELCAPTKCGHPIPSFSLYYFLSVYEYLKYTNDGSILNEVKSTFDKILEAFQRRITKENLIGNFGSPFWNFYEWSDHSAYDEDLANNHNNNERYDLIINCLYILAVEKYNEMFKTNIDVSLIKNSIKETFYNEKLGVFVLDNKTEKFSQFGNSLAYLIGLGDEKLINQMIHNKDMIRSTLSTRCFFYDALLKSGNYNDFIINDIKEIYSKMIMCGSTTVWETELGPDDFNGAGSMCHGWSAIPIYYFCEILK